MTHTKDRIGEFVVYIVLRRDPSTGHLFEDLDTASYTAQIAKSKCIAKDKANESHWKVTPKPESIGKFLVSPLFNEERDDGNGKLSQVVKESAVPLGQSGNVDKGQQDPAK